MKLFSLLLTCYRGPSPILVLILVCWPLVGCGETEIKPRQDPNIVILLVDSLRADSLHDYGNDRKTNPFLSEFGKKGIRFTKAYSHSSHTKISVASLFTGLWPPEHKVRKAAHPYKLELQSDSLSKHFVTLAELLKKKGYRTAAFVTNPHIRPYFGFSQGFDDFLSYPWLRTDARKLNNQALGWIKKVAPAPFFVYLHYMDVHSPYEAPLRYRYRYTKKKNMELYYINGLWKNPIRQQRIDYMRALYEAQINYWDASLKKFINRLVEMEQFQNTLFIIMSDHGEEFYDHNGFGHGVTLYKEQLNIPLYLIHKDLIKANQVRNDPVQVLDIFPTLSDLTNRNTAGLELSGHNLLAPGNTSQNSSRFMYAETYKGKAPRSVQSESYKLIYNSQEKDFEFFDIVEDPQEQKPIGISGNPEIETLRKEMLRFLELAKKGLQGKAKALDKETIQELKSLGYIK